MIVGITAPPTLMATTVPKGRPWNEVLMLPGVKIGRTDPAKDPKGALTVELLKKADKPELAKGVPDHSSVSAGESPAKRRYSRGNSMLGSFTR